MMVSRVHIFQQIRKTMSVFILVGLALGVSLSAQAQEDKGPLKLVIARNLLAGPQEPMDRVFRIRGDYPSQLAVIVTNVSSSSESFYEQASGGGLSSILFEISDDQGNTNVVRKKRDSSASSAVGNTYLQPGEKRVFEIVLNEDTWEGAFKLYKKGSRKFRVRAVYDNDYKKIYSPYYDLIVFDQQDPGQTSATKEEENVPNVLVSK